MRDVYFADYLRLPIGKQNGLYGSVIPEKFTEYLLNALFFKNPPLAEVADLLILATSVGTGGNMARYIGLSAGLPVTTPAYTIDNQCVGSYQALFAGVNAIKSGEAEIVIVGGFESNSLRPKRFYNDRDSRYSDTPFFYANFAPESFGNADLKNAANVLTKLHGFSKADLVDWTIRSNQRAQATAANGQLDQLVVNYEGYKSDENFKSIETLERFKSKTELVDASTSCLLDDGAGLIVLASATGLSKLNIRPEFKFLAGATLGGLPTLAPVVFIDAISACCAKSGTISTEISLFEINESFALKPLLFARNFDIDPERINILGGNLAYGHPFGASGAINIMHLITALRISGADLGLAAASAAGGLGSAVLIQQV